jgi:D-alanyl-D-alanine carboxypeptidase (penicillin-binding protein 5/6)
VLRDRAIGSLPALREQATGAFTAVTDRGRKAPGWAKVMAGVLGVVVLAAAGVGVWAWTRIERPLPPATISADTPASVRTPAASYSWPSDARQAAVAVAGLPGTWTDGAQQPVPIASVTKIMTAYIVLADHPLSGDEQGPDITVTAADEEMAERDARSGDSFAPVTAGEVLTEREALEALLLPSGDNVALMLADWDAGSVSAFLDKMNDQARALGMSSTTYTDPSGVAETTTSTARDQLALIGTAMRNPAFASIVAEQSAQLPAGTGTIDNYNPLTGSDGIIGVKTGTDSAAQACWAFAQWQTVGGTRRVVYGVVLGSPLLSTPTDQARDAIADGVRLASSVPGSFRTVTVLPAGTVVGHIHVPWQTAAVPVVTTTTIAGLAGPGTTVSLSAKTGAPKGAVTRGARVGEITASGLISGTTSTTLVARGTVAAPGLGWRLSH